MSSKGFNAAVVAVEALRLMMEDAGADGAERGTGPIRLDASGGIDMPPVSPYACEEPRAVSVSEEEARGDKREGRGT